MMLSGTAALLASVAVAETQAQASFNGVEIALAILAVAGAIVAWLAFSWGRRVSAQLTALQAESGKTHESLKSTQSREREQSKKLEERQEELREAKQELAAQRKKNHAVQEEAKGLQSQIRALTEERDRLLKRERPAFEATPVAKPSPAPAKPKAKASTTENIAEAQPSPTPQVREAAAPSAPAAAAATAPVDSEVAARLSKLEAEHKSLREALEAERETARQQKNELSRLRRYTEQLRRIDMISKGQLEVLEDRVASLGRQYYEAVSELAAVKGEVVPPRPRKDESGSRRQRQKGKADVERAADDVTDATPHSDALAAQMEAAAAEAQVEHDEDADDGADEQDGAAAGAGDLVAADAGAPRAEVPSSES